jgi:predicted transposase YdaD
MQPPNAHDALFRAAFSRVEHAASELRFVLPPRFVERIDLGTLATEAGSFVDETLRDRHSDLLFSVSASSRRVLLYLLFEHQSTVDPLMAYRLLVYMMRIWGKYLADHPRTCSTPTRRRSPPSARTYPASSSCSTTSASRPTTRSRPAP